MNYNMAGFEVLTQSHDLSLVKEYLSKKADQDIPYEWFFLISFYRLELAEKLFFKDKNDLAYKFMIFALQSNYQFQPWDCDNYYEFIRVESQFQELVYKKIYEHHLDGCQQLPRADRYSNLVMQFLIRYMGYSLVLNNDKIIYTTHDSNDEQFLSYLNEGYTIYRLCPLEYIEHNNDKLKGIFQKIPVISNNPDELIEEFNTQFIFEPFKQISRK